jgi:peptide/nickel transport system permease protein
MLKYIGKRLLWMIPIILGVTILVFTMMTFVPGKPEEIILGATATEADLAAMRESLGLNQPFLVRLGTYMSDVFLHFNLGNSYTTGISVATSIKDCMPRTLALTFVTLFIAYGIGIPLGIMAATHQNKWQDSLSMVLALIGVSIPSFWLALLLVLLFSVKLSWLPPFGVGGIEYYILPAMANCAGALANCARQTRSSMLDVIRADYITTARAKGVPEGSVITKHALKNALIPIITMFGTTLGRLLGGAMIIETIFSLPGMGQYIIGAVNNRDYPVVQGGTIVLAIAFSLAMLIVDLLYAAVDPRIKAQYIAQGKGRKKVKANG